MGPKGPIRAETPKWPFPGVPKGVKRTPVPRVIPGLKLTPSGQKGSKRVKMAKNGHFGPYGSEGPPGGSDLAQNPHISLLWGQKGPNPWIWASERPQKGPK